MNAHVNIEAIRRGYAAQGEVFCPQRRSDFPRDDLAAMCRDYGWDYQTIIGQRRDGPTVLMRHSAIRNFAAAWPGMSTPQIGALFRRHHTSILYALGRLANKQRTTQRAKAFHHPAKETTA